MRYRIRISKVLAVFFLLACRPNSWILFAAGFALASMGEALRIWASGNLAKTVSLATGGPYAMVRNPLYAGSFLIAAGFCLTAANPEYWLRTVLLWLAVAAVFFLIYRIQVASEENHLADIFGKEYESYKENVPAYIPKISRLGSALGNSSFSGARFVKNREYNAVIGLAAVAIFLAAKIKYGF